MAIKGLTPQLAERGKLKIGGLGEERKKQGSNETYRLPVKYDHIVITTMQRDQAGRFMQDKELMDRLMQAQGVQKLTEVPVRLLYDDIDLNFPTRYSCYKGNRCWCTVPRSCSTLRSPGAAGRLIFDQFSKRRKTPCKRQ